MSEDAPNVDGENGLEHDTLAEQDDHTLVKPSPRRSAAGTNETHGQQADPTLEVTDRRAAAKQAASYHQAHSSSTDPCAANVGQHFGEYQLLSMIAKGGMGVVYKARQRNLNRIVAIKMILAGQLADQLDVERFYAEAESAANLRHRHIVAIHEIGDVDGQHFFSMEYVDGKSLSELARENPLDAHQAAKYVRDIATAIQYAHDQGILHRDLKPSNVLVDKAGEPRITDFGLAKRVEGESQLTMTGAIVGTPSYMPPEQAVGDGDAVGTRSDIYSTGAILYELLTGVPPFRAATPFETIRQVLDVEPVAPRILNPSIPRDLETICLKALQKDPDNRYATEQSLADELQRFLNGEPILARPISVPARAWRWCRRNPLVAALTAAAIILLLATLVATTVGYVKTSAALAQSNENFRQARTAVDELFTRVSEDTLLNQPGLQPLRHDLLQRAMQYYQRFLDQRRNDKSLADELATTHYRVGLITEEIDSPEKALPCFNRALEIQSELVEANPTKTNYLDDMGDTWNAIGRACHRLGDFDGARRAYDQAVDIRTRVMALARNDAESTRALANIHMNVGLFERQQQNIDSARQQMKKAQRIRLQYLKDHPNDVKLRRDHGMGFYNLGVAELFDGHAEQGESYLREAIARFAELVEEHPEDLSNQYYLATCHRVLGDSRASAGDFPGSRDLYWKARQRIRELANKNPNVLEYQVSLAELNMSLGGLYRDMEENSASLDSFAQAQSTLEPLVRDNPGIPRYRCNLAVTAREIAVLKALSGQYVDAQAQLDAAQAVLEQLVVEIPEHEEYQQELDDTVATVAWLRQLWARPMPTENSHQGP